MTLVSALLVGIQTPLAPHGDQANSLFVLLVLTVVVGAGIYALVIGFLGWSTRRATNRRATPVVEPDDVGLTRGLWIWAAVIVIGLTVLIIASFLAERSLAGARDRETLRVSVTGHQWWWRIEYRDPATGALIETANELHLPIGRTARIELAQRT